MNKKILIGILICLLIVIIGMFILLLVVNGNNKEKLSNIIFEKLQIIVKGDTLQANMNFIDNYENNSINKTYVNLSKEELVDNGYMEYIQSTDYMLKFYSTLKFSNIKLIEENDDIIKFNVHVKRPNLMNIMNECDEENVDNPNYNFNETFINKIDSEKFKYEENSYEIIAHKVKNDIKFEYDDNFKNMLYSEND